MNKRTYLASVFALLFLVSPAARADYVFDGWDAGTVDGWSPATGEATLEAPLTGGFSGGYLNSTEPVFTFGIVGALNYGPEYTGDFHTHGFVRIQVAVKFLIGSFLSSYVQVRYMDSGHNGWQLPLNADFDDPDWQLLFFDFDPAWTDQQAEAAGWVQEVASPDFATTMTDVFSVGIKATGTGTLSMGIDHFSLQDPSTPSVDMTWGAVKTLYR